MFSCSFLPNAKEEAKNRLIPRLASLLLIADFFSIQLSSFYDINGMDSVLRLLKASINTKKLYLVTVLIIQV